MAIVFAFGSNGSGQLGIGHKEDLPFPQQVLFHSNPGSPIYKIVAGGNHTILVTNTGALFWSGDASSGACGTVVLSQSSTGIPVPAANCFHPAVLGGGPFASSFSQLRARFVAATWEASFVTTLDADGQHKALYSFGTGQKGELGLGKLILRTATATRVPDFPPLEAGCVCIDDLAAGMSHVVVVLSNGDAYGWGNGRKGQLGGPDEIVYAPRKIEDVGFPVRRAVCGREFTCLVGRKDQILVLGSDKGEIKSDAPKSVAGWKDVGASWGNVYVLRHDGSMLSWGRNDHGQMVPPDLPAVERMAIGSEHAVVLTKVGDVLAWGWGEHGNCGRMDENGDVKGRFNCIGASTFAPAGCTVIGVGAGCATSWISYGTSA